MTDTIFVINGPNLNLLGTREPRIYGTQTLDAVAALPVPVIEVHLSNVYAREHFRRQSMIAQVARGSIAGFGAFSYLLALDAAAHLCKGTGATQPKNQIQ